MSISSLEIQIRSGMLSILYRHSFLRNSAISFLLVLVCWTYAGKADSDRLVIWVLLGVLISAFRIMIHHQFKKVETFAEESYRKWAFTYSVGLMFSAVHWAGLLVFITPHDEHSLLLATGLIIAGITSAGYVSSCLLARSSLFFIVIIITALGFRLITAYPDISLNVFVILGFYIAFISKVGANLRASIYGQLRLIYEKDNLAKELDVARKKAEVSSREKSKFLSVTSHEIRTSVNGIVGIMQVLEDSLQTISGMDHLSTMRKSSSDLLNHLNNLLDLDKIEEGKLTLETRAFNWVEVVKNAVQLFKGSAQQKQIELKTVIEEGPYQMVEGDSVRMGQILNNLISNAIKFTAEGTVTIHAAAELISENRIRLHVDVTDTGKGIKSSNQKYLFQTFVQEDESVNRLYGGSGMGLAICQGIARLMNTKIQVVSEEGSGSTFWFEPEFEVVSAEEELLQPAIGNDSAPLECRKCLVVQDDIISQKVAKLLLEKLGMLVKVVDSGEKAISTIAETEYDFVFMDIKLLGIDGVEATRQILAMPLKHKHPKIITLTGSVMESERAVYAQAGMQGCLAKPLMLEDLKKVFK